MPPFPLNLIGDIFHFFFTLIANLLVLMINLMSLAHIPGALGISIIIISILIRLLVWPLMSSQIKLSKKTAELKPKLDELKKKHEGNKQAFALAQSALYKEHGINPAAGCLPSLIQIPVIWGLYQSIQLFFNIGTTHSVSQINALLFNSAWNLKVLPSTSFLGFDLSSRPSDFSHVGILILLVPLITALLTFIQSSMMIQDVALEKKSKEEAEDTMAAMQSQMRFMMPLMIGYFAFSFPVGLALYWNTFTLLGIWQQHTHTGWGGAKDLFKYLPGRK